MITMAPKYTKSRYFSPAPEWHLTDGAPQKLKDEFESDMNTDNLRKLYRQSYPKVKNPYYTWQGKIIDRK